MRKLLRIGVAVLLLLALGGVLLALWAVRRPWPDHDGVLHLPGLRDRVVVYRDEYGVPHIFARNVHDLFYAQGFVHAQDRFWQMEFWRRIGRGRLSEVFGEATLKQDVFIRTLGWHRAAARDWHFLDEHTRRVLEAYAEGVNAYLETRRGPLALEFTILGLQGEVPEPEPWTPLDTLVWAKVMAWDLGGNRKDELLRAALLLRVGRARVQDLYPPYPEEHPVVLPPSALGERGGDGAFPRLAVPPLSPASLAAVPWDVMAFLETVLGPAGWIGSNNWVLAPERTTTGRPILANDPHLAIQMPAIWYTVGLHCQPLGPECPYEVAGVSFPGSPGVVVGHNAYIAWGVTNAPVDVQDFYILQTNPENPDQYLLDGEWVDMEVRWEEVQVRGREEPLMVRVRLTRWGPIFNDVAGGTENEPMPGWQPLAFRWTALEPARTVQAILELDRARNWDDFLAALEKWDVPSQNVVYADVEGNIGYKVPGKIPIRHPEHTGLVPVPGWESTYDWQGYIPYEALPAAFNPPEGFIATANQAIVRAEDYPYFLSADWDRGYRARRIHDLLTQKPRFSPEDVRAIQRDDYLIPADVILPHLENLHPQDVRLQQALGILQNWDRRASVDSVGATLFETFRMYLLREIFADELGPHLAERYLNGRSLPMLALARVLEDAHSPWYDNVYTPDRVETKEEVLLRALEKAVDHLTQALGKDMDQWRWGRVHTATFVHQTLGKSGVVLLEKVFNRGPVPVPGSCMTVNNMCFGYEDPFAVRVIPSYRQVFDVGNWDRGSWVVHSTGQVGHPYHPHYDDQIPLWQQGEYMPLYWDLPTIQDAAREVLTLEP